MQFSTVAVASALTASALAYANATTITEQLTVTEYTTYCPEPTVITITVCEEEVVCSTKEIEVKEPGTVTITEPCIIETEYVTICEECQTPLYQNSTVAPPPAGPTPEPTAAPPATEIYEGGAHKNVVAAMAGVAALAAALV